MAKRRVLLITRNLPPLIGGMERLMQHTVIGLADDCDLTVIGPRGCRRHLPDTVQVVEVQASMFGFLLSSIVLATWRALRHRPEIVIGGSGLLAPTVWCLQTLLRVPGLVFVHGLDIVVANRMYQLLFVPWLKRLRRIVANSHNTAALARQAGVRDSSIRVLHPGTELPDIDRENAGKALRAQCDITAGSLMLFVGRITPRKGLREFVEKSLPEVLQRQPDACLLVVGEDPVDSLASQAPELHRVIDTANALQLNDSLQFLGQLDDEQLLQAYCAADVLIFPLVETPGDVEGFGMVAIEAAACGTPTVAFAVGGVADAVSDGRSGYLVEPGNYPQASACLLDILSRPGQLQDSSRQFAAGFEWGRYNRQLRDILEEL